MENPPIMRTGGKLKVFKGVNLCFIHMNDSSGCRIFVTHVILDTESEHIFIW